MRERSAIMLPLAAASLGIASFSAMDATMKGVALGIGAYNAMLWRVVIGAALGLLPWLVVDRRWPTAAAMRVHLLRGIVVAVMAVSFFYGITLVPLAEAIALSFVAPLIALYLAAVLLGETIGRASIVGSLIGLAGVGVLLAARAGGGFAAGSGWGFAAVLFSAVLYAFNLILMRRQALVASPTEVSFFQNVTIAAWLLLVAPLFAVVPERAALPLLTLASVLAMVSILLTTWAYARAEAKLLVPVEYTAFIWAAIMGAMFFGEALTLTTLAGAVVIVAGCLIATLGGRPMRKPVEVAL